jgi:hypothetical protein
MRAVRRMDSPATDRRIFSLCAAMSNKLKGWAWKDGGRLSFTDPMTETYLVIRLLD